MADAGAVAIQGCAIRVARLNADGSISSANTTGMIVDDKPFVTITLKPNLLQGVDITPVSACGAPLISYKDYDRNKRWDTTVEIADIDFDKWEMIGGGSLLTAASSSGRSVSDGVTTLNSTHITSATAAWVSTDVGRTVTSANIPAGAIIVLVVSATEVVLSAAATASGTAAAFVIGTLAARTVGYQVPALLAVNNPNGVSLEVWMKAIVRGTGYQGTTPYPSVGTPPQTSPSIPSSAYMRLGVFRFIPMQEGFTVEDKESARTWSGWSLDNPNFGTGPAKDWTVTGLAGGAPLDTTRSVETMMDFALPATLGPGYQTTA